VRVAAAEAQRRHQLFSPVRGLYVLVPRSTAPRAQCLPTGSSTTCAATSGGTTTSATCPQAARHGASHQAVQVTQVVVDRRVPDRSFGSVRLRFYADGRMAHWPAVAVAGPTGTLRVRARDLRFDLGL